MSLEQSLTTLTNAVNGIVSRYDEMHAGYAQKAEDLVGLIRDQSLFAGYLDKTRTEFSQVDGGWFDRIADIFSVAPNKSQVVINLEPGQTIDFDETVTLYGRSVLFRQRPTTEGIRPKILFRSSVASSGLNQLFGISPIGGGSIDFDGVDVAMEDKADPGAAWSVMSSIVRFGEGTDSSARFRDSVVTGHEGQGLISCGGGSIANLGLKSVTMDGPISGIINADQGVANLARNNLTLLNGATLTDGAVQGANLLNN